MEKKVEHIEPSAEIVPINLHPELKDAKVISPMDELEKIRKEIDQLPSADPTQQPDLNSSKILQFRKSKSAEEKEGRFEKAATWLTEQLHKFKKAA